MAYHSWKPGNRNFYSVSLTMRAHCNILYGGKVHDLARVTKNLHVSFKAFISTPWRPPVPFRGVGVMSQSRTSTHLGSIPGRVSYSTPASFWRLYMQYTQLGSLPLRDKGIPQGWFWTFCLNLAKSSRPGHKDPSSPRPAKIKCVARTLWSQPKGREA